MRVSSEDRQTAIADAQDAVAAYNAYYSHWSGHIAAAPIRVAPHIYQFVIKENGKRSFGRFQINTRQFWAGNNNGDRIDLHGVGVWGGKCKRR